MWRTASEHIKTHIVISAAKIKKLEEIFSDGVHFYQSSSSALNQTLFLKGFPNFQVDFDRLLQPNTSLILNFFQSSVLPQKMMNLVDTRPKLLVSEKILPSAIQNKAPRSGQVISYSENFHKKIMETCIFKNICKVWMQSLRIGGT